jgi:diguanylate cyclase (GGDEF)-like protein
MKRRSISQILLYWSFLALGVITLSIGYFLLQLRLDQFENAWQSRIQFELSGLRNNLEYHIKQDSYAIADRQLSLMATSHSVDYIALVTADDMQVHLATKRADIGETFPLRLSSYSFVTNVREIQTQRKYSHFYSLLPLKLDSKDSNTTEKAWLFAHYDASHEYQQMLQSVIAKTGLIAAIMLMLLAIQHQVIRQQIFRPLSRLTMLTESLQAGKFGNLIKSDTSEEMSRLETAFNELSSHLQSSELKIGQQQAWSQAFTTAFPDVGLVVNGNGIITERFGHPKSPIRRLNGDLAGTPYTAWLDLSEAPRVDACRQRAMDQNQLEILEFNHGELCIESRMIPFIEGHSNTNELSIIWLIRDVTDIKRKQQLIEYQANYDPLTDLANRRMVLQQLEEKIRQASSQAQWSTVLFIDLDHFKNINDSLGHPIGDRLLIDVARRLRDAVSNNNIIARLGGDEFLIVSGDLTDKPEDAEAAALKLGQTVLDAIRVPFSIDINRFHLSASIGVALFPSPGCGANDLVRQADTAMYRAKHDGRSRISIYNHQMQEETRGRLHLFNDLYQAIRDEAFTLVFQPQHDHMGRVTGAEALCRWINNGQSIYPDVFIAAAEETNLILPLGDWVIMHACQTLHEWIKNKRLPESFQRLAVNISAAQFMADDFESKLQSRIAEYGIPRHMIELELTESLFMGNKDLIREKMHRLNQLGYTFALDDFGTGYSSLSYLQKLPINKLKIDRAFVMDIDTVDSRASIVDAIIQLGRNLNMEIIAEGVETLDQKDYLGRHGCNNYQGYYFSRPLRSDAFITYINTN